MTIVFIVLPQTIYVSWKLLGLTVTKIGDLISKFKLWRQKRKIKKKPSSSSSHKISLNSSVESAENQVVWLDLALSLPGLHIIKRCRNFIRLIRAEFNFKICENEELKKVIVQSEEDKLYGLIFYSGPQLIMQSAISMRLDHPVTGMLFLKMLVFG